MFLRSLKIRHYTVTWFALLLLLSMIVPASFAQDQQFRCGVGSMMQTIAYGDTVKGSLDYNQIAFYCFDAQRGDTVTVTVAPTADSGNLVPSVLITKGVNESQQDLFNNAYAGQDGIAPLQPIQASVTIDADNTYMIVVFGAQGTRGEYSLNLQVEEKQSLLGPEPSPTDTGTSGESTDNATTNNNDTNASGIPNWCKFQDVGTLTYDERVTGSLTDTAPQALYCFEAKQGDIVHIRAGSESGDLVPLLVLADQYFDGSAQTIYDQDSAGNSQGIAQIVYQVPQDGSYLVVVTSDTTNLGDYYLEMSTLQQEDLNFSCETEPLSTLSNTQWGLVLNADEGLSVTYNVGCMGEIVMNVFGGNIILNYKIDPDGTFNFVVGDNEFKTVSLDANHWVIQSLDNKQLDLQPLDNGTCSQDSIAQLVRGAWTIDGSNNAVVIDFMCNGTAFVVNQGQSDTANYTLTDGNIVISLPTSGQVMFSGAIEVNGDNLTLRDESGEIPFVNTLAQSQ